MSPAVPVVMDVTVTLEAFELSMSILPVPVESADIDVASSDRAVELPMPVAALRSTVAVVTRPAPFILPAEVMVTWSADAVTVPVSIILPLVVVVSVTFFDVPAAVIDVPTVKLALVTSMPILPLVVEADVTDNAPPLV